MKVLMFKSIIPLMFLLSGCSSYETKTTPDNDFITYTINGSYVRVWKDPDRPVICYFLAGTGISCLPLHDIKPQ